MSRLQNARTIQDMMVEMADGNPGAAVVLIEVCKAFNPGVCMALMINLDSKGIYGSRIWFAYKYCFLFNVKDFVEWVAL